MWNKFLCWLLGHKVMIKAFTGNTLPYKNYLGMELKTNLYKWEKQKHCLRCGKRNDDA